VTPTPQTPSIASGGDEPADRHRVGQRLFRGAAIGALMFELAFIAVVLIALIVFVDAESFVRSLTSPEIIFSIKLTIITVTISTGLSMLLAIPAAYALSSYRGRLAPAIDTLLDLPIVVPPVAAGLALLILFGFYLGDAMDAKGLFLPHTRPGIVVAQFFATMTYSVRSVKAALDSISPRLPAVARTLGSNQWRAFRRVTLPLARNGILAGAVLSWSRCLGLFGPVIMFCGATRFRTEILPTSIYLHTSVGQIEQAVAGTLILLIFAVLTLFIFKRLGAPGLLFWS
jgi:molybdate transport system permease protein